MSQHPFDRMKEDKPYHERMALRSAVQFEEGKVRYTLSALGFKLNRVVPKLVAHQAALTGSATLTFSAFNALFPSFPVLLGVSQLQGVQLHLDPTAMIPAMFKAFGNTAFVRAYDAFYSATQSRAHDRIPALVFSRKGFKNGMIIYLADDFAALPIDERETVIAYAGGNKAKRHWLLVRSFQKTLEAIYNKGHGWRPTEQI